MTFFTQSHFPRLWLIMQNTIGGNTSKQILATEHYHNQRRILEIGCSVGNISETFRKFPGVTFTGIDIDRRAVALAQQRFHNAPNFRFCVTSLDELSHQGETFDYVLFAGMLHHVDDTVALQLLSDAVKCTADGGRLVIYEPEALNHSDGWFLRFFYKHFEHGRFLRSRIHLMSLVTRGDIEIESIEDRMISPGIVSRPFVARFNLLVGKPATRSSTR